MTTTTATRRLAAILAADVVGYSRLMGADEEGTLAALNQLRRELADPKIKEHRGAEDRVSRNRSRPHRHLRGHRFQSPRIKPSPTIAL
jgi:class 3 adenylate cyclase